ncbi:MAG: endonuclease V [Nitrososphaerales archaeon]
MRNLSIADAVKLQLQLSSNVIKHDVVEQEKIKRICGVDVTYRGNNAFSSAVVVRRDTLDVIDSACIMRKVQYAYVPGLLFLRESEPILAVLKKLNDGYDVLMVDGHGLLHPRRFGIASYIGIKTDKPTVGVGKSLLCGNVAERDGSVLLDGEIVGRVLKTKSKPIYVSVGHKVSLQTAVKLVKDVIRHRMPEPLRLADINSRKMARESS